MTQLERDFVAGRWVPSVHGRRFRLSRLLRDKRRSRQDSAETFKTFGEAKAECDRRNGRPESKAPIEEADGAPPEAEEVAAEEGRRRVTHGFTGRPRCKNANQRG